MSETAFVAKNMFGDQPYQQRARAVLPILVRQAQTKKTVYYSDLAFEVGMPNHRNLNYVLGSIGTTLHELSAKWRKPIPPIQSLVINQGSGLPGHGLDVLLGGDGRELTHSEREVVYQKAFAEIFAYPRWDEVLQALELQPVDPSIAELANAAIRGGAEESEEHKRLKFAIAADPTLVGLKKSFGAGETEFRLPSGDELDVLFRHGREWVAVEVMSRRSAVGDISRGAFQCVKYSAVLNAWRSVVGERADVRVILALETALPFELVKLCNALAIEIRSEIKIPE